jgi:hypothetical protein
MRILGSARDSRAGFGALAETKFRRESFTTEVAEITETEPGMLKFDQLPLHSLLPSQLCLLCRSTPFAPFSVFSVSSAVNLRGGFIPNILIGHTPGKILLTIGLRTSRGER